MSQLFLFSSNFPVIHQCLFLESHYYDAPNPVYSPLQLPYDKKAPMLQNIQCRVTVELL